MSNGWSSGLHVQQREQRAARVPQREFRREHIVGEPEALDLQAAQFDAGQFALLVSGAVQRQHLVDLLERGARHLVVRLGEDHLHVGATDLEAQLAERVPDRSPRRLDAELRLLGPKPPAPARFEFLLDADDQFLVVEERRAVRLREGDSLRTQREGGVRPLPRADHVGLRPDDRLLGDDELRVARLGDPKRVLERESWRHCRLLGHRRVGERSATPTMVTKILMACDLPDTSGPAPSNARAAWSVQLSPRMLQSMESRSTAVRLRTSTAATFRPYVRRGEDGTGRRDRGREAPGSRLA